MAKSLAELSAERGFDTHQPTTTGEDKTREKQTETGEDEENAAQETDVADEIKKRLSVVRFSIRFLRDPEKALLEYNLQQGNPIFDNWKKGRNALTSKIMARITGDDPEQIEDESSRTEEQKQVFREVEDAIQEYHIEKSRYSQSLELLKKEKGNYPDIAEPNSPPFVSIKEQAILYFFALHDEEIAEMKPLTDKQKEELIGIFHRLDSFYCDYEKNNIDPNQTNIFYAFIEKENKPSKHKQAENQGALMTIGERLFAPSDPEYQNAFITSVSANIGLYRIDPENGNKKQLALDYNTPFIQALAKAVLIDFLNGRTGEMGTQIYFPTVARELNTDSREKTTAETKDGKTLAARSEARQAFIHSVIADIDTIWGKLPHDATEYKLISVLAYNPETEILYFVSPYLQKLIGALVSKEADQLKSGKHYHIWHCDLLHASAANERIPAAVEMATRLLVGVQQRGLKPDAKLKQNKGKNYTAEESKTVSYHITCKGLIDECPQIREKLKSQPNARERTRTLNRAFTAMYRILRNKTDLFTYYKNVRITEAIPTSRSLEAEIIITHTGADPAYKKPSA